MDREALTARIEAGDRPKYLYFWGHTAAPGTLTAACLSQWYPSPFVVAGVRYATAEHWMMAEKARLFGDAEALEGILTAKSPGAAKAGGRAVRGFDSKAWGEARFEIVVRGNVHKFGQDDGLRSFLLATGERVLVEASPRDRIWGIGLGKDNPKAADPRTWRGQNLLGFALMEARSRLRT